MFHAGGDDNSIQALSAAVDELASRPVTGTARSLATHAAELHRLASRLEALELRYLAAADAAALGGVDPFGSGAASATHHVAITCNDSHRSVRTLGRTGRWLADFPDFATAAADGHLHARHLRELKALDNPRTHHQLVDAQPTLVDAATTCDWPDFVQVCGYWLLNADPDGAAPDADDPGRHDHVHYRRHRDGTVTGRFRFHALAGQAFTTALDAQDQRCFRNDSVAGTHRAASRRRADALLTLVATGHAADGRHRITPLVNIVMSEAVAENTLARLADPSVPRIHLDGSTDHRSELIDGTPIHPDHLTAALATAVFRRVVLDARSRVIDTAANARSFPPWMKHLLLIQARGRCQAPGCDAPLPWLQADHIHPHTRGGPTRLDNGQILCDPHNKHKRDHPPEPGTRHAA